ncbi:MAG: NAD-dependent epimerase/dehydratase family protein [Lewinellaceae bacterium]|nr:NAD-dependent epimerase/dehydratase family protein [Phaeodactylibacter sp.]MCB9039045.1 NAD-dependent epimerase/dehydratase family protein [Lewinellaceae bacterium]
MTEGTSAKDTPILITGATGFVGSYLLRYLLHQGYRHLRAMRRESSSTVLLGPAAEQVEWVEGDLTDPVFVEEAMSGMKKVYHCAAVVSFDPRKAEQMMQTNGEGTANIVNSALHHSIGKLLHVSSISTLGRAHNGMKLSEKDVWQRSRFNTHYGTSKYLAEQEVWRGMAEGLSVAIVNPSVILGSGKWDEGTAHIFKTAAKGLAFYPEGATGFVDVRDVARFSVQLMESDIEGQRFILNAENQTYKWLIDTICQHVGATPPSYKATLPLRAVAWRLAWLYSRLAGKPPLLTRETATQSSRTFYYENQKSLQAFPFAYHPIEKTIAETCRQLLEAREEGFAAKVLPF